MLAVILKILSVIGIILLCLLGVLLAAVLLVLFFPIVYRVKASKTTDSYDVSATVRWLFGLVNVKCRLPEPGNITAKVLFFKVFEMYPIKNNPESVKKQTKSRNNTVEQINNTEEKQETYKGEAYKEKTDNQKTDNQNNATERADNEKNNEIKTDNEETDKDKSDIKSSKTETDKTVEYGNNITDSAPNQKNNTGESGTDNAEKTDETCSDRKGVFEKLYSKLSDKYEKTVYTIRNFYDKIKNISDEASFYKELLEEENTKELIRHVFNRIGRILKSIRPGKLKADITFGAATPDVTGYVYGIYAMFSSVLGRNFNLNPDFTENILEGNLYAAGHITVFVILINVLSVIFDKKLKILRRKLKRHSAKKKHAEQKAA
jgi:hypothetical protein